MHFSESLKKNRDFRTVYREGRSYANRLLVISRNRIRIAALGKSSENYEPRRKEDGITLKKILIFLIKWYRKYISPMKTTKCPYYPTCSTYGLEAVEKYGAWKGGLLALWRILRCNPFSKGGYDPVP